MRKKILIITIAAVIIFLPVANLKAAVSPTLKGKIFLQVEHLGEAWYVHPETGQRYYLKDGPAAFELMRKKSLGISNSDLAKIPKQPGQKSDSKLVSRLSGYILLQVENHGEAWYLNPADGLRYYLKDGPAAFELMRNHSVGITNDSLRQIPINDEQLVFDQTFNQVAHVALTETGFKNSYYGDKILPLASLTKLMTALVLLDLDLDWQKIIEVTQADLDYPKQFVNHGDITSEINLEAGDKITLQDLWIAMLVASSNQSAALLAKHSGLNWNEFILRLNQKAKNIGLEKTIFTEPSGLDLGNIGTAKEMAKIADAAFSRQKIADTTIIENFSAAIVKNDGANRDVPIINRNHSLMKLGAQAAKTGFLTEAQRNVALKLNNKIIVVLHARSLAERNNIINKIK